MLEEITLLMDLKSSCRQTAQLADDDDEGEGSCHGRKMMSSRQPQRSFIIIT